MFGLRRHQIVEFHGAQFLQLVLLLVLLGGVVDVVQPLVDALADLRDMLGVNQVFAHQMIGVLLGHRRMTADLAIQNRLGIARVVAFVVTMPAIAEHVDHHVALESLAIIVGHLRHADARVRIVAVDMEDGRLHHARHVG